MKSHRREVTVEEYRKVDGDQHHYRYTRKDHTDILKDANINPMSAIEYL